MPRYFGSTHGDAYMYATTAGAEYVHQALARAIDDGNDFIALGSVEALGAIAGQKSLLYNLGTSQPLIDALSYNHKAVRYSAALAMGRAGPQQEFAGSQMVTRNLSEALLEDPQPAPETSELYNKWSQVSYPIRAAEVLLELSRTRNPIIDVSGARQSLINASQSENSQLKILAGQALAYLNSPGAQRAIAQMGLDENNPQDVRIQAFYSLATGAKVNGNLLDDETISGIYGLVGSEQVPEALRTAASIAYGALDLPSEKVKELILDQAKT
jgi:hypothetical protein